MILHVELLDAVGEVLAAGDIATVDGFEPPDGTALEALYVNEKITLSRLVPFISVRVVK